MPITRRQFDLEIDAKIEEWMKKIHKFLSAHKEEAFTESEISSNYNPELFEALSDGEKTVLRTYKSNDAFRVLPNEREALSLALAKLVELEMVKKAIIRGQAYYAFKKNLNGWL